MQGLHDRSRDATAVMRSYKSELMLDKSSMPRAVTIAEQASAVSELLKQIQENPEAVRETFKEIRRHSMSGGFHSLDGSYLRRNSDKSVWRKVPCDWRYLQDDETEECLDEIFRSRASRA